MDLEKAVTVTTFLKMTDADLAAAELRSAGIECTISSDDAGGVYPSLSLIKLLVDPSQLDQARQILNDLHAVESSEPFSQSDTPPALPKPTVPPPPFAKFGWGLLVGAGVGALLHWGYVESGQFGRHTFRYDNDGDGLYDEVHVWLNGTIEESRYDRNADGRIDQWSYYQKGTPSTEQSDSNFDGRPDVWSEAGPRGSYISSRFDSDFNGIADAFTLFKDGQAVQTDWRPNGTNVTMLRQVLEHGVLKEDLADTDGNGQFDVQVVYDPFNKPVTTNWLGLLIKSASPP